MEISNLTTEAQAGFAAQAIVTGESVDIMTTRLLEELGITYFNNNKQRKLKDMYAKINVNPDAYVAAIDEIAEVTIPPDVVVITNLAALKRQAVADVVALTLMQVNRFNQKLAKALNIKGRI